MPSSSDVPLSHCHVASIQGDIYCTLANCAAFGYNDALMTDRLAGVFAWGNIWPYCMVINNFSQAWAIYVLMLFYMAMHTELQPLNPLRKFVTIKLVVFFSFWQGLLITLLCSMEVLRPHSSWRTYTDRMDFSGGLQDTIICIEMYDHSAVLMLNFMTQLSNFATSLAG